MAAVLGMPYNCYHSLSLGVLVNQPFPHVITDLGVTISSA